MEPSSSGASLEVRKIAVGPSAPPMMAMEAACFSENPSPRPSALIAHAPRKVKKIPPCAAAPSIRLFGLAISGEKSVMAPIPMKISDG